jgi:fucose 4-O-acetylase-like acetyltransferase
VHLVVILHSVLTTDFVVQESLVNEGFKERKLSFFRYMVQYGIPTFFLLSGIGASNYKTEKHGFIKYSLEKFKRLALPFFLSLFIFLIPRLYVAQEYDPIGRVNKEQDIEWDFFTYAGLIMKSNWVFKLGQLWFLPVLMVISILIYPLIAFSRRRMQKEPLNF